NNIQSQEKFLESRRQIWGGFTEQVRLSDKWLIWADGDLRTKEQFVNNLFQLLLRPGLTYLVKPELRFTAGYTFVNHYPIDNHQFISQPENRYWLQFQWLPHFNTLKLSQRLRFEKRFRRNIQDNYNLAPGYYSNSRLRYQIQAQYPLSKRKYQSGTFSLLAFDELMVNVGKKTVLNYFDQNRFFIGLAYHFNENNNLQFGYLNVFQQFPNGYKLVETNAIKLTFNQIIDLRKK
ncbi:MAG: DUF2490 domain-containing protein, partial [Chitinophagaceae bacterium]